MLKEIENFSGNIHDTVTTKHNLLESKFAKVSWLKCKVAFESEYPGLYLHCNDFMLEYIKLNENARLMMMLPKSSIYVGVLTRI